MTTTTSALARALETTPGTVHRCPFGRLRDQVDDTYRERMDKAVALIHEHRRTKGTRTPGGPNVRWLVAHLADDGHTVTQGATEAHIAGRCNCRG